MEGRFSLEMDSDPHRWHNLKRDLKHQLGTSGASHWMDELQLLSISPKRVVIGGLEHEIYRYDLQMNHEAELRSALARFYPDKGGFHDRLIEYRMGRATGPKKVVEQVALPFDTAAESTASTPPQFASDSANPPPPQRFQPPVVLAPAVGEFNQLACRAADAILDAPGQRFNPCTIFGKSGLGKTRLLHYLRDALSGSYPDVALQLVSAEEFLNEFVQSLRKQRMAEFRKRYRTLDVLLVDGLQILKDAKQAQTELLHTVDTLRTLGKQVVLTALVPPSKIDGLLEPLASRLEQGMVLEILEPSPADRRVVLDQLARQRSLDLPPEVFAFVAETVQGSVGKLEGALLRLEAHVSLMAQPITLDLTKRLLHDLIPERPVSREEKRFKAAQGILKFLAWKFEVGLDELTSTRREQKLVRVRQIAVLFLKEMTSLSLTEIGELLHRNHSTMHSSLVRIEKQLKTDSFFRSKLNAIREELLGKVEAQDAPARQARLF